MADFYPAWNNTCQKVIVSRDEYGDYRQTSLQTLDCVFRIINTMRRGTHMEIDDADAMVWFPIETDVTLGTLLVKDGVYYQIERINYAQGLRNAPQFIKCDLKITVQAVS